MNKPLVQFINVSKTYDGMTRVVDNLQLSIEEGEFVTLLGPSGSGKTTSLMMLAGFEAPTSGQILIGDRDVTLLPPQHRNTGVVFQNYALFPNMNVRDNVGFPLRIRHVGSAEIAERVNKALTMVRMEGFADRAINQLSGGQQQRIALARVLVFEPRVVLMDEPLGALDKQLRQHMQLEIKHLHERLGLTVLFVTHDQEEALTMSDRVAVFHQGIIQQIGSPNDLYERPANRFVAEFLGDNNVYDCDILRREGGLAVVKLSDGQLISAREPEMAEGGKFAVCIRPEAIKLAAPSSTAQSKIRATVEETIYLGQGTKVRARWGSLEVTATFAGRSAASLEKGSTIDLFVDPHDIHLAARN
ncbi:ABC transporter ATP-binding protein [Mesorhizobium sp. AaZ16]|uniref:ABC transporter ATP-binding protein n=1 Tax=Mesorhizobium sp. AaZ16 TaxID=3402289 RepID=UPI00374F8A88